MFDFALETVTKPDCVRRPVLYDKAITRTVPASRLTAFHCSPVSRKSLILARKSHSTVNRFIIYLYCLKYNKFGKTILGYIHLYTTTWHETERNVRISDKFWETISTLNHWKHFLEFHRLSPETPRLSDNYRELPNHRSGAGNWKGPFLWEINGNMGVNDSRSLWKLPKILSEKDDMRVESALFLSKERESHKVSLKKIHL